MGGDPRVPYVDRLLVKAAKPTGDNGNGTWARLTRKIRGITKKTTSEPEEDPLPSHPELEQAENWSPLLFVIGTIKDKEGYQVDDKALVILYTCLSFTVARKLLAGKKLTKDTPLFSPFWTEVTKGDKQMASIDTFTVDIFYLGTETEDRPLVLAIPPPVDKSLAQHPQLKTSLAQLYNDKDRKYVKDFREFCDRTFSIVLLWLNKKEGPCRTMSTPFWPTY